MAIKIVVKNTDEEIQNYKIGQQFVRYRCDCCGNKRMIKISHIEDGHVLCDHCNKNQGYFEIY